MTARVFVCLALAPAAFADYYVTSRDVGKGDLYRYSNAGTFLAKLPGNGLSNGQGVIIGPNGNLLVSNEGGSNVLQYNPATGAFAGVFASLAGHPGPIVVGPDNNVYVGIGGTIVKLDGTTGAFISNFVTTNVFSTAGLAFGPNGNLFVSDGVLSSIHQYNGTTGAFINDFATNVVFTNGAGPLLFYGGHLLVSQAFGQVSGWGSAILEFDQTTGAFLGNFVSDPANLNGPSGLLAAPDGNLYVVNYVGNTVVKYSPAGAFLGLFANTAANGAQASRFIVFANVGGGGGPTTPVPSSLTLMLVGIAAISGWFGWHRLVNRRVHHGA